MKQNVPWWKSGVIYQLYPRSFLDTDGDGTGDLPGITAKLDYLADLGVDGIWLSPINCSPMFDFGYDISDYREIDPVFGRLSDFQHLLDQAHQRGIRVILDLVVNHTSHLHPWFVASRASRDNPKRGWYIWRDGKNKKPPNNWLAAFGGGAWQWDEPTGQYYLHSFLKEQPDLNWRNPEVRQAIAEEMRFWLDMGVDGFRLDVINFFVKDENLRANPFGLGPTPRPYDLQKHIYDRNRPETLDVVRVFRGLTDQYDDRMMVGEVYTPPPGDPKLSATYLGTGEDALHLSFDFSIIYSRYGAGPFMKAASQWMESIPWAGWPCQVLNNHDQPRSLSRYGRPKHAPGRAKILAALLLTLRGTPFIYYGEEIGMVNGRITRRQLVDPLGKKYWPLHKGRDPERTPMQWSNAPSAGFSTGDPWLPVNPDYPLINVEAQQQDPNSLLHFYRNLIALRRKTPALSLGDWQPAAGSNRSVMAYYRSLGADRLLVVLNFDASVAGIDFLATDPARVVFGTHRRKGEIVSAPRLKLAPHEVLILG
ncbi:MAG: alpha-glucosidase [Desulfobacterales bacterium]|nr:alpha-glucosidase [Desulfobacterales bacterium]